MIAKTNAGIFRVTVKQAAMLSGIVGLIIHSITPDYRSNDALAACADGYDAAVEAGLDEHGDNRTAYSRQPTAADKARQAVASNAWANSIAA